MYRCLECGKVFEEDEVKTWKEDRGEYWGVPCHEELSGCPYCYGAFEKAEKCSCCEEYIEGEYIETEDDRKYCRDCYRIVEV